MLAKTAHPVNSDPPKEDKDDHDDQDRTKDTHAQQRNADGRGAPALAKAKNGHESTSRDRRKGLPRMPTVSWIRLDRDSFGFCL
jgi:hypothetical protein